MWRGACNPWTLDPWGPGLEEPKLPKLPCVKDDGGRDGDWAEDGRVENVMDAPLPIKPPLVPVDDERVWGAWRGAAWDTGVTGTCAMCPMPAGARSMLRTVVGLVLAAMLRNVRDCDRYEEEECEREGDGGELGGSGRNDASSSASRALAGDHIESRAKDDWRMEASSSSECWKTLSASTSFREMVRRWDAADGTPLLGLLTACL